MIYQATAEDVPLLLDFRREASAWLKSRGSDQWAAAWPDENGMTEGVRRSVAAGTVWLIQDGPAPVATLTLDEWANPDLWTPAEAAEPALYLHRLIVRRRSAGNGLGAELIDWCGNEAYERGKRWLRLDAWTTNADLHRYYLAHGFKHVRTRTLPHNPSGALFQRLTSATLTPRLNRQ